MECPNDLRQIQQKLLHACENTIEPVIVKDSPCKEIIETGDAVNVEKFPAPRWHPRDGGRYIGTLGVVISQDPETGIRNASVYREQIMGKNKIGLFAIQHAGMTYRKYQARG